MTLKELIEHKLAEHCDDFMHDFSLRERQKASELWISENYDQVDVVELLETIPDQYLVRFFSKCAGPDDVDLFDFRETFRNAQEINCAHAIQTEIDLLKPNYKFFYGSEN